MKITGVKKEKLQKNIVGKLINLMLTGEISCFKLNTQQNAYLMVHIKPNYGMVFSYLFTLLRVQHVVLTLDISTVI